jgi:hypothetical protein
VDRQDGGHQAPPLVVRTGHFEPAWERWERGGVHFRWHRL